MEQRRIIAVINTLSTSEWKSCKKYVLSQLGEIKGLLVIWNHIVKNKKQLTDEVIKIKTLVALIDSTKSYVNKLLSTLTNIVDEFIIISDLRSQESLYQIERARAYYQRGLYHHGDILYARILKDLKANRSRNLNYHLQILDVELSRYFSDHPEKYTHGRAWMLSLHENIALLACQISSFILMEIQNRKSLHNESYDHILGEVMLFTKVRPSDPLVSLFDLAFQILTDKKSEGIKEFIQIINAKPSPIDPVLVKPLIVLMSNFLTAEIKNDHKREHITALLELYQSGINHGVLLHDNQLSLTRMITIIEVAGVNGELDWLEIFIKKTIPLVTNGHKKDVKDYIEAHRLVQHKKWDESFSILSQLRFTEAHEEMRRREVCCITCYEVHHETNIDLVLSQVNNYEQWLVKHTKSFGETNLNGAKNFLKVIKMFINKSSKSKLRSALLELKPLRKKNWIGSKVL